ncbi:MAG: F0F1 ATP synthase subunit delta [Bacteroidetes bacterium]|nr:F0F1 ATP synthase subunit delta [Bacteroidota bacterium]MBU1422172.1 F0F1 ATP synthase subunit delta [Bacteroidota bacterium]MBU2637095.1 F0F1 ATP synthase subunit delta [Bacteroidota bacterium]
MKEHRVAQRYARAVLQLAEEQNKIDRVTADFQLIEKMIKSSRDFVLFLQSPIINAEKKKKIFLALFKDKVDELTFTFILLLANKNREMIIPAIISQYNELLDEKRGMAEAEVTSAAPFTDKQSGVIMNKLESMTKKKIRMKFKSDPALIGGFKVRIKDTVWDGSILHQFETLREKFSGVGKTK